MQRQGLQPPARPGAAPSTAGPAWSRCQGLLGCLGLAHPPGHHLVPAWCKALGPPWARLPPFRKQGRTSHLYVKERHEVPLAFVKFWIFSSSGDKLDLLFPWGIYKGGVF